MQNIGNDQKCNTQVVLVLDISLVDYSQNGIWSTTEVIWCVKHLDITGW